MRRVQTPVSLTPIEDCQAKMLCESWQHSGKYFQVSSHHLFYTCSPEKYRCSASLHHVLYTGFCLEHCMQHMCLPTIKLAQFRVYSLLWQNMGTTSLKIQVYVCETGAQMIFKTFSFKENSTGSSRTATKWMHRWDIVACCCSTGGE